MFLQPKLLLQLAFILFIGQYASGYFYKFYVQNDEIFSDCENQPSNVGNIHTVFDMSNITLNMESDVVTISGNTTTLWNIEPDDRIQLRFQIFRMERGVWQPTIFTLTSKDLCKGLFDETQYWYMYFSKYIENKDEIRRKCINVPGTQINMARYQLEMYFDLPGIPMIGYYNIVITFKAFDSRNVQRDISICASITGEIEKLK